MSVIVLPHTPVSGQVVPSVGQLANFTTIRDAFNNTAVQTDVAKTIAVAHTWAADILFTDALYDIGKSGATRPRDMFLSRNLTVGGTATVTGALNFSADGTYLIAAGRNYTVDLRGGHASAMFLRFKDSAGGVRGLVGANAAGTGLLDGAETTRVLVTTTGVDLTGAVTLSSTLAAGVTSLAKVNDGTVLNLSRDAFTAVNQYISLDWRDGVTSVAQDRMTEDAGGSYARDFHTYGGGAPGALTHRMRIAGGGQVLIGTTVTTGSAAGDLVLANAKALRFINPAGTAAWRAIRLAADGYFDIAGGFDTLETYVRFPGTAMANLPIGSATANGVITFDTTNNRLIIYVGGARYPVTMGAAF